MVDAEVLEIFSEELQEESQLLRKSTSKETALQHLNIIAGSAGLVGLESVRELASHLSETIDRVGQVDAGEVERFLTAATALVDKEQLVASEQRNSPAKPSWWKFW